MNYRKVEKIERKLLRKGSEKMKQKEKLLMEIKESFNIWLELTRGEWWKKKSR